jgi:hypothetical protein
MRRTLLWSISALMLTSTGAANADEGPKGDYVFVGSQTCLASSTGFNSSLQPNDGAAVSFGTNNFQGRTTYKDDGTGSVTGTFVYANPPPQTGKASAGSGTFSYSFTYSSVSNGTFTSKLVPGSYKGTQATGPRAGQTFTIDNADRTPLISKDGKTIANADTVPTVENITFSGDPKGPFPRICWRQSIAVRD